MSLRRFLTLTELPAQIIDPLQTLNTKMRSTLALLIALAATTFAAPLAIESSNAVATADSHIPTATGSASSATSTADSFSSSSSTADTSSASISIGNTGGRSMITPRDKHPPKVDKTGVLQWSSGKGKGS
nr:hypothetical protein B0A51_00154 [Rachicladosporium sp. CCFEE 5018]